MELLAAVFLSFGPAFVYASLLYWVDRFEAEPKILLGAVFTWGALVATFGAVVSQTVLEGAVLGITGSAGTADVVGATLFAPLTEESLKGLAVLVVFFVFRREFDSILDGIVYAGTAALGFAATENVLYLLGSFEKEGWEGLLGLGFMRVFLGAWDHPFYTAFIGIGLAVARLTRHRVLAWVSPVLGWAAAIFFHSMHNSLATLSGEWGGFGLIMFATDWAGWLAMGLFVIWAVVQEGRLMRDQLAGEVASGVLSAAQHKVASSSWSQLAARMKALTSGHFAETRRLYKVCGELAHKKAQVERHGDEGGNVAIVERLRADLQALSARVPA